MRAPALALALLAAALAGCAQEAPTGDVPACAQTRPAFEAAWRAEAPRVRLVTSEGAFVAELAMERAPATVANFLALVESGSYDGTRFHRVVRDFVIQGGDPLTKDDDPANDGTGDPGYEIPDEFHPELRHDDVGILSMANSGPDTGGSQFFVTLGAAPHLDDRHSVFGRVVEGLDVVGALGETPVDANDAPLTPVVLERVERLDEVGFEPTHGADVHVVVDEKRAEAGRPVRFAVVMKNEGSTRDALALTATPPAGWGCEATEPEVVPAGTARVGFLTLTPPPGASGVTEVQVRVIRASDAEATAPVDAARVVVGGLGRDVREGDEVVANYAGLLPDGRLFDTSMASIAQAEAQPKFETLGGWRAKPAYQPFPFTVGSGVIEGFTALAKTAKVGETVTGRIAAQDAYAAGNPYERPLTGRDLVFELEILSVR